MKRIISLILVAFFAAINVVPTAAKDEKTAGVLLYNLGIIKDMPKAEEAENAVTRGELAAILIKVAGCENLDMTNQNSFDDVKSNNPYKNEIEIVYSLGLVNGKSQRIFAPDDPVTTEETAKIITKLLGYEVVAEKKGGYPDGYMNVCYTNNIFAGVNAGKNAVLRKNAVYKIIENALETDMLSEDVYNTSGEIERSKVKGKNLLTEKMELAHCKGIVDENYISSLTESKGIQLGYVSISGKEYQEAQSGASDFLGYSVEYYVKESDDLSEEPEIIYIFPSSINDVTTIDVRDLTDNKISLSKLSVTYKKNNEKKYTKSISPYADFLYNGVKVKASAFNNIPNNGKIELIDNDGDSRADVVKLTSYKTIVVDGISQKDLTVYDKYTNQGVNLDLNKEKSLVYLSSNGKIEYFKNIKKWSILSVAENENQDGFRCVSACHSRDYVDGTLNEKDEDYITINSTEYRISGDVKARIEKAQLGTSGRWYIDAFGDIAALDEDKSYESAMDYAFVTAVGVEGKLDKVCKIKILQTDGDIVLREFASQVSIDGEKSKKYDASDIKEIIMASGNGTAYQPIRCGFNSLGQINKIDTLLVNKGGENDKLVKNYTSPETGDLPRYSQYAMGIGVQRIEFLVNSDVKVFNIPILDGTEEDEDFTVGSPSGFAHLNEYNLSAYDYSDTKVPGLIVIEGVKKTINKQPEPAIVIGKSAGLAKDESYKTMLKLWYQGKVASLVISDESILSDSEHIADGKIESGDVIIFALNDDGEIDTLWKYYNCSNAEYGYIDYKNGLISTNDWWFYANLRLTFGRITAKDGDTILFSYSDDLKDTEKQTPYLLKSTGRAAVFSKTKRAVKPITKDELNRYISTEENSVNVLIATASGTPYDVIVFDDDVEF